MDELWWELPGPSRYVRDAIEIIEGGESVVLALPRHAPDGLREAVYREINSTGLWYWRSIAFEWPDGSNDGPVPAGPTGSPSVASIAAFLARELLSSDESPSAAFVGPDSQLAAQNVRAVARAVTTSVALRGAVIWVDPVGPMAWPGWREFLEHYAHVRRNTDERDAPCFCVAVEGVPQAEYRDVVGLSTLRWHNAVDRLDLGLYLASSCTEAHPARRRLVITVAAELAGPDPRLACELARLPLSTLLSPHGVLQNCAAGRGWSVKTATSPTWHDGALAQFEEEPFVHSAALCLSDPNAVNGRIWRGQISVLFPLIERHRQRLLRTLNGQLSVPIATPFGMITDVRDLEIGQIRHQIRKTKAQLPPTLTKLIDCLAEMRTSLAHLEPVDYSLLTASSDFWKSDAFSSTAE